MTMKQWVQFLDLAERLSPENLHCDGEISNDEADTKFGFLMRRWRKLEEEVGRVVEENEPWEWFGNLTGIKQDDVNEMRYGFRYNT